jgi:hypothetical protein
MRYLIEYEKGEVFPAVEEQFDAAYFRACKRDFKEC